MITPVLLCGGSGTRLWPWSAPPEWSGLIVSAWWASGPLGRCFRAQAGGRPESCAAWPLPGRALRCNVPKGGVGMGAPLLDQDLRFGQAVEHLAIEKHVAEPGVEAFAVAVFPRWSWLDIGRLGPNRRDPVAHLLRNELGAIVGSDLFWWATQDEQVGQRAQHVRAVEFAIDADHERLPGVCVDDIERPVSADTPSSCRTWSMHFRRREGLRSFPLLPRSGSACPTWDRRPRAKAAGSPSPALSDERVAAAASHHRASAIGSTSSASRRSGAPPRQSSRLVPAELQPAEASTLSLRASLVCQPARILKFEGQIYPSWWNTFGGLFQVFAGITHGRGVTKIHGKKWSKGVQKAVSAIFDA